MAYEEEDRRTRDRREKKKVKSRGGGFRCQSEVLTFRREQPAVVRIIFNPPTRPCDLGNDVFFPRGVAGSNNRSQGGALEMSHGTHQRRAHLGPFSGKLQLPRPQGPWTGYDPQVRSANTKRWAQGAT